MAGAADSICLNSQLRLPFAATAIPASHHKGEGARVTKAYPNGPPGGQTFGETKSPLSDSQIECGDRGIECGESLNKRTVSELF